MIDFEELGRLITELEIFFQEQDLNETEIDLLLNQIRIKRSEKKQQQKIKDNLSNSIPGWGKLSKMLGKSAEDE